MRGFGFWSRNVTPWSKTDVYTVGGTLALAALTADTVTDTVNGYDVFAFPLILGTFPLILGMVLGPKRRIAWTGAATMLTELTIRCVTHWDLLAFDWQVLTAGAAFAASGAVLGVAGAALRGFVGSRKSASHAPANVSTSALP